MNREYTDRIMKCLQEVHYELGPGLISSIYEEAVARELSANGFSVLRQVEVPILYKGQPLGTPLTVSLILDGQVILDIQSVPMHSKISERYMFTCLVCTNCELGFIVNFNVDNLHDGTFPVYNFRRPHREKR